MQRVQAADKTESGSAWKPDWLILFSRYERSPAEWRDKGKERERERSFFKFSLYIFILKSGNSAEFLRLFIVGFSFTLINNISSSMHHCMLPAQLQMAALAKVTERLLDVQSMAKD